MKNIKIYTTNGNTILLDNVNWNKIKKEISKKNYDGSYTMNNGDIIVII